MSFKVLCLMPFLIIVGCDTICSLTVSDFTTVQNNIGQDANIEFCVGGSFERESVLIRADQSGTLEFGDRETSYIRGGFRPKCERVDGERVDINIALTDVSFFEVKLCSASEESLEPRFFIVDLVAECPAGYTPQKEPSTCALK